MIVASFDLSSACIGVIVSRVDDDTKEVEAIKSCPIVPGNFSAANELGFLRSKKTLKTKKGDKLSAYAKPGEEFITISEKKKRDREVRTKKNSMILDDISNKMGMIINAVKPDLIIVEKNSAFNGILTTVLLAEVMGTLLGIAGMLSIPVEKYSVTKVRSILDLTKITSDLIESLTEEEIKNIPDVTKRAIGKYLSKIYGIDFQTDDESDACAVFHYWLKAIK